MQIGKVWVLSGWGAMAHVEAELIPPLYNNAMAFGSALAFNELGDLLFVGARASYAPGRAFVYRRHGRSWVQEWETTSGMYDWFGFSVAVDATGDLLAVGAPRRDNPGPFEEPGAVVIYRRQGSSWSIETTITPAQLPEAKDIGNSVALSRDGTVLAVSSQAFANSPVPSGAVYVLEHSGGAWVQVARLQEPVAYSWGGFANRALAMDSEARTLVAGNSNDSRIAYHQGAVSIFRKGSSGWAYDTVILPANPVAGVGFGTSVSINAAGDRLRVGATGTYLGTIRAGAVEEFEFSGGAWQRAAVHFSPTPEENAALGMYVVQGTATGNRWLATEPWSDAYAPNAGQMHFFEANCLTPTVYCTAQPNTLGCVPQIAAQGTASASSSSGFTLSASNARNQQNGMLFYSTNGRASLPWLGATLCVQPPLRRTPLVNSGGASLPTIDCSGVLARDFNAWAWSADDPALFPGQRVRAQFYSRDPGAPQNVNLTDAIEFYLEP
jgi:hypothetical protein